MGLFKVFTAGFLRENPVFVLVLGLCPSLAVTSGVSNAIGMGLAATFVLIGSNVIISLVRKLIPDEVRIPCYIVIIATFVTVIKLVMAAYTPELKEALGIFLPLIVVNCIILGRAEAYASKNGAFASMLDGAGMGLGFTLALLFLSSIREVLGSWKFMDIPLTAGGEEFSAKVIILAPGGFMLMGLSLGFFAYLGSRRKLKLALAEKGLEDHGDEPVVDARGGEKQ